MPPSPAPTPRDPQHLLPGGGEMGARTREFNWGATSLGPIENWPASLLTTVQILLDSRYAMWLGWGPDFTFFYNDAYARMSLGPKHPWALGKSAREVWSEIWPDVGPRAESVLRTGEATWDEGLLLFLERSGFTEETYHTFSYSPVRQESGAVGGMLCVVTEDTRRTIGERRLRALRDLAARTTHDVRSAEEACQTAARILSAHPRDVPFVLLYLCEEGVSQDGLSQNDPAQSDAAPEPATPPGAMSPGAIPSDPRRAELAGWAGLTAEAASAVRSVRWSDPAATWPFAQAARSRSVEIVTDLPDLPWNPVDVPWPDPPRSAAVLPLAKAGQTQLAGFLVAGLSPRLALDDDYRGFLDLLAGQIATAITEARAYQEERRRAEALAELDRAKTTFFSNVSHEFRTPLTLMMGPVEDLLVGDIGPLPDPARRQLELVHRNSLRLLRLVNSILDFSRIEAGRVRAHFEPTDLPQLTAELASVFRSTYEKAGLTLVVDCPPLREPVYVDREMWEKIVLNLLSNAFKFTLEGEVRLTLQERPGNRDGMVELRVSDTGIGISETELPRLFERFHRVPNARGRTHEGSGIGLALVQELVRQHGGSIRAESAPGRGTTFLVELPLGKEHLPADRLAEPSAAPVRAAAASAFVEEALRWLPAAPAPGPSIAPSIAPSLAPPLAADEPEWGAAHARARHPERADDALPPLVLVADDNADMRDYVARLMAGSYRVIAVADGAAALESARAQRPDLILTDIMMPRLDGFGLLRALRADAGLSEIPVIMLSARAGEESRVEGIEAGADDYLVKPFSARELLARVGGHLQLARLRRESGEKVRASGERLRRALNAARMIAWEWNPQTDEVVVSDNISDVFGTTPGEQVKQGAQGAALIVGEDRTRHLETLGRAVQTGENYFSQYRMVRPDDGRLIWLEERGHTFRDPETQLSRVVGVTMDVTERKHAEWELQKEREWLRVTLSSIGDAVITTDVDGNVTFLNPIAQQLTGWNLEAAAGRPLTDVFRIINESSRKVVENPVEKVLRSGVIVGLANHTLLIDRAGDERPIDDSAAPIRDLAGEIVGVVLIFRDVGVQRGIERQVRDSEQRYRLIAEVANDAIWDWDLRTNAVVWNEGVQTLFGYTAADVAPTAAWWYEHIHPEDRDRVVHGIHEHIDNGQTHWTEEYRFLRADGTDAHVFDRGRIVRGPDGAPLRMVGSMLDLTERLQAEKVIRQSEERYRMLFGSIDQGFCVVEVLFDGDDKPVDYRFLEINPTFEKHSGIHDAVGKTMRQIAPQHESHWFTIYGTVAQTGEPARFELPARELDNRWFDVNAFRIGGPDSRKVAILFKDITAQKDLEHDLRRTAQSLRDADRRKDEFLATLAHELRNPLAPIRTGVELLRMAGDDPAVADEVLRTLEGQTGHLVRLVDDLLDVSRITSGKVVLRRAQVELADVIQRALEATKALFTDAQHELIVSLPAGRTLIEVDQTRLAQIVTNLLTNAARYTPAGGRVWLTATVQGSNLLLSIRDTGIGIPRDMLERVFDMFEQVDRSLERTRSGLGIGLTLVRRLVELHGGTVTALSAGDDQGSEFRVQLPIVIPTIESHSPRGPIGTAGTGLRVLIADDNKDAARMLALVVSRLGHTVQTAADGLEAVRLAEEFRPELMLLDIGMPFLNGYEACRKIRSEPWGQTMRLVALTGWGQEEDRRRSREAGFDEHLVKPVEPDVLRQLLERVRRPSGGR